MVVQRSFVYGMVSCENSVGSYIDFRDAMSMIVHPRRGLMAK